MIEIGRLCIKTAGRDAGKRGLVIDIIDDNYVLIDGEVRRRKCNITHLEPLDKIININKKASHDDVKKALKEIKIEVVDKNPKEKKERPKKQRKVKEKEVAKGKEKVKKGKATKKEKTAKEEDAKGAKKEEKNEKDIKREDKKK